MPSFGVGGGGGGEINIPFTKEKSAITRQALETSLLASLLLAEHRLTQRGGELRNAAWLRLIQPSAWLFVDNFSNDTDRVKENVNFKINICTTASIYH